MIYILFGLMLCSAQCSEAATVNRAGHGSTDKLVAEVKNDGSYRFAAGSDPENFFLLAGDVFLQADTKMHSTDDGSLKLQGTKDVSGSDATGLYQAKIFQYVAGTSKMNAQVAVYNDGEFVRFTQSFPQGIKNCNVSDKSSILSSFPSFKLLNQTKDVGFLATFGDMFGYGYSISDLRSHHVDILGGDRAGPLVLFDAQGSVMIISSFSSFMAHNMKYDVDSGIVRYGVIGGAAELPKHYQIDTILYYSNEGINKAVEKWGQVLMTRYHKKRAYMEADFSINYLGYYTDNGAYYYYHTEEGKNYETTMLDVVEYAKSTDIPYGYLQYDSWWYYKGVQDGVKNWTSMDDVFPHGMDSLFQSTGLPVVAHNRYWASDTTYAKKNGGSYDFYVETEKSIPDDPNFWNYLIRSSKAWGLITYEQDWLDREFDEMTITHTNVSVARDWLIDMGKGAVASDVTIQYCMGLPRHMMQSAEIQAVTQARVSGDYHPGNGQWKIGVTSMFAHALYIAPYKDKFWTTSMQKGSPYGDAAAEPNTELQAAISTLSTGPVGPSDAIGMTNVDVLMKCCRADGLIIKPSRPITTTDDNIMKLAFPDGSIPGLANAEAEIYTTFSDIRLYLPNGESMLRFGIVLAAQLTTKGYKLKPSSMYLDEVNPGDTSYVIYQGHPDQQNAGILSPSSSIEIPICETKDFQLWYASPLIKISENTTIAILGERSKWVPVSSRRIRSIEVKGDNLLVDIVGKPGEMVAMDFMFNSKYSTVSCAIPSDGVVRVSANSGHCIRL
ncbi:unnamed protein product [Clavelina lepadiformis]|uniref:Uncharacterized protein n=1 Tax=Clavelina lepadiformis TaxID=159417 RepID=A0ABP0FJ88_CLALP